MGMWLFLAALFMLFSAGLLGWVVIRNTGDNSKQHFHLPAILWLSTALVVGVSFTMSRAVARLRRERPTAFLRWIGASLALSVGFLLVQTPAMVLLLWQHRQLRGRGLGLYGLLFFLILVHALHVVGGMVALVTIAVRGRQGVYDHEHYLPVRHAAMYWHFLDLVWLSMFFTFLATA